MAYGPLFPYSIHLVDPNSLFPNVHVGGGANSKHDKGIGVVASLGADATARLRFQLPPILPTGQCKIVARQISAVAATQVAKFNPKWASVAANESPSGAILNAETTQTLSLVSGDADDYKDIKVNLDADTPVAGEVIVMDLVFETSGWTLAVISTWIFFIIWE